MTVSTKVLSIVFPVVVGSAAAVAGRALLAGARRFVVGERNTPPDGSSGGAAWVWTGVSWVAAGGIGVYVGKAVRAPSTVVGVRPAGQPAQS